MHDNHQDHPRAHNTSATAGADKHAGHSVAMFRDKFWLSLILTVLVVLYSEMIQEWLGFRMPSFPASDWIPFVLGTIIFFYGGTVFIKSAWGELQSRQPGMMTLISLAIISAFLYSIATTFFIEGTEFFWELATLILVMLFGHWMEMRSVANAQGALQELAKLLPDTAELLNGQHVPVSELAVGEKILIRPGSKIPADGTVSQGQSDVNEAMITGESKPVEKNIDDNVIAGTVNGSGSLTVTITKVGEQTALAGIMRLVAEAQNSKSRAQILADKAAFYLTIIAIIAAVATFAGWIIKNETLSFTMERVVTVLVIACPHALGLAIPLVTSISTTLGARNGLLVKQRMALESARNLTTVLFDKTGTLTRGEQSVVDVWPLRGKTTEDILHLAGSVEQTSEHSLGKAIVQKARDEHIHFDAPEKFKALAGHGVEATLHGKNTIAVGGPRLLESKHLEIPKELAQNIQQAGSDGKTALYVLEDGAIIGAITIADEIRKESREAVEKLQRQGLKVAMITGDSAAVAGYVARQLGLDEFFAEVLPEYKADKVKELQGRGEKVAMVGDGVNDAPALTQADLGVAVGAGTDVAIESAGIVLVKSNPLDIPKIIKLSKATYRKMLQNLFWATGYNIIAIPLAAGLFGIILPAAVGALLMSISTVIVAINAQLLRKLKL